MVHGFRTLAPSVAIVPALIGCGGDTSMPTEATVQLAIVAGAHHGLHAVLGGL